MILLSWLVCSYTERSSILAPGDYDRWLGVDPDPRDLMRPFPAELMRMWPLSTRVNKPENDDRSIPEPIELATEALLLRCTPLTLKPAILSP
jgi:putative SOS response-associated peptidase YedK